MDPALNQINFKDCETKPYTLEFKNPDIEESYLETKKKNSIFALKWISISMAFFLFIFNYFSSKDYETENSVSLYLIHAYADLLFYFGFLLFFDGNLIYFIFLKKSVILQQNSKISDFN